MAKITVRVCAWCGKSEGPGRPPVIPSVLTWCGARAAGAQMKRPDSRYFHLTCMASVRALLRYAADVS